MSFPTRKVMVEMTFVIPVEVPVASTDEQVQFQIEENSCPASYWADLKTLRHNSEVESVCWACGPRTKMRLVGDWKKGDETL